MRVFDFGERLGREITHHLSASGEEVPLEPSPSGVQITPIVEGVAGATVVCLRFRPGAVLGRHPAAGHQLFLVVDGEGWASGAEGGRREVKLGYAVWWEPGEAHESGSASGMTALVVEAAELDPTRVMQELEA